MLDILIAALIIVESHGNPQAIGDGGRSVGCLQIQMCVIEDVNRVYGMHYTAMDRYSKTKSVEIAKLYLLHWGQRYTKKTGLSPSQEVLARIWNGGPRSERS